MKKVEEKKWGASVVARVEICMMPTSDNSLHILNAPSLLEKLLVGSIWRGLGAVKGS